jgi:hypothetical protein
MFENGATKEEILALLAAMMDDVLAVAISSRPDGMLEVHILVDPGQPEEEIEILEPEAMESELQEIIDRAKG